MTIRLLNLVAIFLAGALSALAQLPGYQQRYFARTPIEWVICSQNDDENYEGRQPDAKLLARYRDLNKKYFDSALPDDPLVVWDAKLHKQNKFAQSDPCPKRAVIRMNARISYADSWWELILLHEMVHLKLWLEERYFGHGERFQQEMKRLASAGAFDQLW